MNFVVNDNPTKQDRIIENEIINKYTGRCLKSTKHYQTTLVV